MKKVFSDSKSFNDFVSNEEEMKDKTVKNIVVKMQMVNREFYNTTFNNVVFSFAPGSYHYYNTGNVFIGCKFVNCTFESQWRDSKFHSCEFSLCKFISGFTAYTVSFEDSYFTLCTFNNISTHNCNFHGVTIHESMLHCTVFYNVDFTSTSFLDTTFDRVSFYKAGGQTKGGIKFDGYTYFKGCYFDEHSKLSVNNSISRLPKYGRSFIAYKKIRLADATPAIAVLEIPHDAYRTNNTSNKCRASKAKVVDIYYYNYDGEKVHADKGFSMYNKDYVYTVGDIVYADSFNLSLPYEQCDGGIHFFLTEAEAISYDFN